MRVRFRSLAEDLGTDGTPNGIAAGLGYATDLFDEGTVAGFARRLQRILETVTATPDVRVGDIDILGTEERRELTPVTGGAAVQARTLPGLVDLKRVGDGREWPNV